MGALFVPRFCRAEMNGMVQENKVGVNYAGIGKS